MNNLPRQKLCEIVTQRNVLDDPRLCEALLRDLCGEHKREIFVLVAAQKERVAADLLAPQAGVPREVLLTRLTRRLQDNLALTEDAAQWAVESWALALGFELPRPAAPVASSKPAPAAASTTPNLRAIAPRNEMVLTVAPGVTMDFVHVPAGTFLMGSTTDHKFAEHYEKPQHTVEISYDYWIARCPVTNEQFARVVAAAKYKFDQGRWQTKANHPVVSVSWHDATAYCQWLNATLRGELKDLTVCLPTEAEWEKAARGMQGNEWPWGNAFDRNKCNSREGGKQGTTPVGAYSPQGDSPYGAADMVGNVWEWCHSLDKPYPYQATDGRESEAGDNSRVLRGGSWFFHQVDARCASRFDAHPGLRRDHYGFRCCASPGSRF